jgi:hypothetical protein
MTPLADRSLRRFTEELAIVDEVANSVLKGHLLIDAVLAACVPNQSYLEDLRLGFAQKVQLARAFAKHGADQDPTWSLILQINSTRNDLAHKLQSTQRAGKLAALRRMFLEQNRNNPKIEELTGAADASLVIFAYAVAAGFLVGFQTDAERLRSLSGDHTPDNVSGSNA